MGNEHAKSGQSPVKADLDTSKLDLTIKQIFYTARLSKDRKKGLANSKVKELNALVNQEKHLRKKDDEYHKATSIVNDLKIIHALELIMTYCDAIKDNLGVIKTSKGDLNKISELTPYVESIIWGCQKCNIEGSEALVQIIQSSFGPEARDNVLTLAHVTQQLQNCFDSVLPSNQQVHDYLIDFCRTQNFDIQKLNEVGHNITIPTQQTTANIHPETRIGNIVDNKESIGHRSQETPNFAHGNFFPDGFSQNPQSGYPDQKQVQGDVYMSFGNTGHQRNIAGDNVEERKMDSNDFIRTEESDKGNNIGGNSKYPDFAMFSMVGKNDQNGSELNQLEDRLNAIKKNL